MDGCGVNYWPRWISAIKKRTATLSLAQMGAYDRLLDHYYSEEQPLPEDIVDCYRIAGALSKSEQDSVRFVLARFFQLSDGGYRNERADNEIQIALPKIAAAQANGQKGGRPKGSKKKPSKEPTGFSKDNPAATRGEPRAKAPHPHPQKETSEPDGSDAKASAIDPIEAIFALGVPLLTTALVPEKSARSMLGLLRKQAKGKGGDQAVLGAIRQCIEERAGDPVAYLAGCIKADLTSLNRQEAIEAKNQNVAGEWAREQGAAHASV